MPGKDGTGPRGPGAQQSFCICPRCKTVVRHSSGIPCSSTKCPKCSTPMTRKDG